MTLRIHTREFTSPQPVRLTSMARCLARLGRPRVNTERSTDSGMNASHPPHGNKTQCVHEFTKKHAGDAVAPRGRARTVPAWYWVEHWLPAVATGACWKGLFPLLSCLAVLRLSAPSSDTAVGQTALSLLLRGRLCAAGWAERRSSRGTPRARPRWFQTRNKKRTTARTPLAIQVAVRGAWAVGGDAGRQ